MTKVSGPGSSHPVSYPTQPMTPHSQQVNPQSGGNLPGIQHGSLQANEALQQASSLMQGNQVGQPQNFMEQMGFVQGAPTPQTLLANLNGLQQTANLHPFGQMLQPLMQQLSQLLQGPLAVWPPQASNQTPMGMLQTAQPLAQLLPQLLQQLSQMPTAGLPFPTQNGSGGFSLPKQEANIRSKLLGQPIKASDVSKSIAGVGAQTQTSTSTPIDKDVIKDMGRQIAHGTKSDDKAKALSKDPKAMALATPDQKGRMIGRLIKGHTTDSEDRAIARILESCTSKKEFDAVMSAAGGAKKVRKELDDKGAKRHLRNITKKIEAEPNPQIRPSNAPGATLQEQVAAIRQDAKQWSFKSDIPAADGISAQEACAYFERIEKARKDDDAAEALAKDPKAMALASNDDKAAMVRRLIKGHTTDPQDRAMVDILESCTSKEDFEEVMNKAGGKDVVDEMDHGPSEEKMNMLVGAWGRTDWANNKGQANLAKNALADPQIGADLAGLPASSVDSVGPYDPTGAPNNTAGQAIHQQRHTNKQRSMNIHREPRAYKELIFENAKRKSKGQEPLDWSKATEEVHNAMEQTEPTHRKVKIKMKTITGSVKVKELDVPVEHSQGEALNAYMSEKGFPPKKFEYDVESSADSRKRVLGGKMEELRKKYGVGKEEFRDMFTYRQGEINRAGAKDLSRKAPSVLKPLQERYQNAVQRFGATSLEAQQAKAELDKAQAKLGTEVTRMGETADAAESFYPTPLSGLDKFVGFFEKFGELILDIVSLVLNVIPGIGSALYAGYHAIKFVIKAAQEDVLGALSSVANAVTGIGGAVTGAVSAGLKAAGSAIRGGVGIAQAAESGNPLAALNAVGGMVGGVGDALGKVGTTATKVASDVMRDINKGMNIATSGIGMAKGIAEGNPDLALSGLGGIASGSAGFAGGMSKDILSGIGTGVRGINDLVHGRVGAGIGQLQNALEPALTEAGRALSPSGRDTLKEINNYLAPGAQFIEGLATGRVSDITNSLLDMGGKAGQHIPGMDNFLKQKGVQEAFDVLGPLSTFAGGLIDNNIPAALNGASGALQSLIDQPDVKRGIGWARDLGNVLNSGINGSVQDTFNALGKSGLMKDFLQGVQSGELDAGLQRFSKDVGAFLNNPQVQQATDWLRAGTHAVQDLVQGRVGDALNVLGQAGSPFLKDANLQGLQDFVKQATPFLNSVGTGSLDKALGQIPSLLPSVSNDPGYQQGLQNLAPFYGLMQGMISGNLSNNFRTVQHQLEPLSNSGQWMAPIQELQTILDGGLDLSPEQESLLMQVLGGSL